MASPIGKRPAFQFYTGDWMKDPALRSVSLAARGLWIDLLALMFESPECGHLVQSHGAPPSIVQVARMTGCTPDEADAAIRELESAGVFSRTETGVIYSRRMVRDENKRLLCVEAGKRGGNPTLKGRPKGRPTPPVGTPFWPFDGPTEANEYGSEGGPSDANGQADHPAGITATLKGQDKGRPKGRPTPPVKPNPTPSSSTSVLDPPTPQGGVAEGFDEFWSAYPRRVKKIAAEKAWNKLRPDPALRERIVADVRRRVVSVEWQKDSGQFIPHPASYLNGRRWEDEEPTGGAAPSVDPDVEYRRAMARQRESERKGVAE